MNQYADALVLDEAIAERVAVLRRYRQMLELQRGRLQDYLQLLDTREAVVKAGDFDSLEEYTLMEQEVIKGIMETQRCMDPLAEMYRAMVPEGSQDIDDLQKRLESLRQKVLVRNEESRALLKHQMVNLKAEIDSLRIPPSKSSVFSQNPQPRMIDIEG